MIQDTGEWWGRMNSGTVAIVVIVVVIVGYCGFIAGCWGMFYTVVSDIWGIPGIMCIMCTMSIWCIISIMGIMGIMETKRYDCNLMCSSGTGIMSVKGARVSGVFGVLRCMGSGCCCCCCLPVASHREGAS